MCFRYDRRRAINMLRFIDKRELSVCLLPCTRRDQLGQPKQFISLPTHNKTQNETIRYVLSTFFHLYLSTFFRPRLVLHLRVIVWIDAPVCFIIGKDLAICPSVSFADNLIIQLHYRSTLVTTFFFILRAKRFSSAFFIFFVSLWRGEMFYLNYQRVAYYIHAMWRVREKWCSAHRQVNHISHGIPTFDLFPRNYSMHPTICNINFY